jgi:ABC-type transporter Mla MlaB component
MERDEMEVMAFSMPFVAAHGSAPRVSRQSDSIVVWLDGEQDLTTVPVLADMLAKASSVNDADLIVDVSAVTMIDTATIEALLERRNTLHRQCRSLTLRRFVDGRGACPRPLRDSGLPLR